MGIFSEWQWQYEERGISTFPVNIRGRDKKPAINGYLKVGLRGSSQLAEKFRATDAFGIPLRRNGLAVVDVDHSDERVLSKALDLYGPTPLIVRTLSGHFQAYYRRTAERRLVRPHQDSSFPVDVLGDGYAVAAPSKGEGSARYEFIQGDLDAFDALGPMRQQSETAEAAPMSERIGQGNRRNALLGFLRPEATRCRSLGELVANARDFAARELDLNDGHPFTDAEIVKEARSVWKWTEEGNNFTGEGRRLVLTHDTLDRIMSFGPDVSFLFQRLKVHNWGDAEFPIANAMADTMPGGAWTLRRLQKARSALIDAGIVVQVRKPSSYKGAALFRWT